MTTWKRGIGTAIAVCLVMLVNPAQAASGQEIDAKVSGALKRLYKENVGAEQLVSQAAGILVFPEVYKGGFFVGGEYGEGALLISGRTVDYYSAAAASVGFQIGAQRKSQVVLFMTQESLSNFRSSDGWKAGVDGSVALASLGAGGAVDTNTAKQPVIGFIYSNEGLMYNLTFEGSKFTRIDR